MNFSNLVSDQYKQLSSFCEEHRYLAPSADSSDVMDDESASFLLCSECARIENMVSPYAHYVPPRTYTSDTWRAVVRAHYYGDDLVSKFVRSQEQFIQSMSCIFTVPVKTSSLCVESDEVLSSSALLLDNAVAESKRMEDTDLRLLESEYASTHSAFLARQEKRKTKVPQFQIDLSRYRRGILDTLQVEERSLSKDLQREFDIESTETELQRKSRLGIAKARANVAARKSIIKKRYEKARDKKKVRFQDNEFYEPTQSCIDAFQKRVDRASSESSEEKMHIVDNKCYTVNPEIVLLMSDACYKEMPHMMSDLARISDGQGHDQYVATWDPPPYLGPNTEKMAYDAAFENAFDPAYDPKYVIQVFVDLEYMPILEEYIEHLATDGFACPLYAVKGDLFPHWQCPDIWVARHCRTMRSESKEENLGPIEIEMETKQELLTKRAFQIRSGYFKENYSDHSSWNINWTSLDELNDHWETYCMKDPKLLYEAINQQLWTYDTYYRKLKRAGVHDEEATRRTWGPRSDPCMRHYYNNLGGKPYNFDTFEIEFTRQVILKSELLKRWESSDFHKESIIEGLPVKSLQEDLLEKFSSFFDEIMSHLQGIPKFYTMASSSLTFLFQIMRSRGVVDVALAVNQLINTFTPKMTAVVAEFAVLLGKNFYKLFCSIKDIFKQNEVVRAESLGEKFDMFRDMLTRVLNSQVVVLVRNFLITIASLKFFGKNFGQEILTWLKPKEKGECALSLIEGLFGHMQTLLRFGDELIKGTPLTEVLCSTDPMGKFMIKGRKILDYKNRLHTGKEIPNGMNVKDFMRKSDKLIKTGNSILEKCNPASPATKDFKQVLSDLKNENWSARGMLDNRIRDTPYGLMFVGTPGTGKSGLIPYMHSLWCKSIGVEYEPDVVWYIPKDDDFDEGYEISKEIGHMSELGNQSAEMSERQGDDRVSKLCSMLSSESYPLTMAALEKKASTYLDLGLITFDTNTWHLNADRYASNPAAIFKRFVRLTVTVREEYRKPNSTALDPDAPLVNGDKYMDKWIFELCKYRVVSEVIGEYIPVCTGDIYDITMYLYQDFKDWRARQNKIRENMALYTNPDDYMQRPVFIDEAKYAPDDLAFQENYDVVEENEIDALEASRIRNEVDVYLNNDPNPLAESKEEQQVRYWVRKFDHSGETLMSEEVSAEISQLLSEEEVKVVSPEEKLEFEVKEAVKKHDSQRRKSNPKRKVESRPFTVAMQVAVTAMLYVFHCADINNLNFTWKNAIADKSISFWMFYSVLKGRYWFVDWSLYTLSWMSPRVEDVICKSTCVAFLIYVCVSYYYWYLNFLWSIMFAIYIFQFTPFMDKLYAWLAKKRLLHKKDELSETLEKVWAEKPMLKGMDSTWYVLYGAGLVIALKGVSMCIAAIRYQNVRSEAHTTFREDSSANERINEIEELMACGTSYDRKVPVKKTEYWNAKIEVTKPCAFTEDPEQLMKTISRNIYLCHVETDRLVNGVLTRFKNTTHIFGINSNNAIINTHAFKGCSEARICVYGHGLNGKVAHVVRPTTVNHLNRRDCGNDVSVVKLDGMQFRDFRHHINSGDIPFSVFSGAFPIEQCKPLRAVFHDALLTCADSAGAFTINKYFKYALPGHAEGHCGLPLIIQKNSGCCIGGIHVAGDPEDVFAYSLPLDIASIEKAIGDMSYLMPIASDGVKMPESMEMPISQSAFRHEILHGVDYFGKLPGNTLVNNKSQVTKTKCHNDVMDLFIDDLGHVPKTLFGPPMMEPFRSNGEYISPMSNGLRKMAGEKKDLDPVLISKAVDIYFNKITEGLDPLEVKIAPLTLEVAINGIATDPFIRRIKANTAAGFGFFGDKSGYIPIVEEDPYVVREPTHVVKERLLGILEQYINGETAGNFYKANLKDEPRAVEKIPLGKTRVYYASALDNLIIARSVLGPIYTWMVERSKDFNAAVGINAHVDMDDCILDMEDFSPLIMEGDYVNFDQGMPFLIGHAAATVIYKIAERYGYNDSALRVLSCVLTDSLFPYVEMYKDLFCAPGLQPSGMYGTAENNSIRGNLMLIYGFLCNPNLKDLDFYKYVLPLTYGDDFIAAVKAEIARYFNNITYKSVCEDVFGIGLTPALKNNELQPFLDISTCSFLKRRFVYREDFGRYVAPLDMDSILRMLTWTIKSKEVSPDIQIDGALQSALRELFFHMNEDEYEKFRPKLISCVGEHYAAQPIPETLSFSYLKENLGF